MIPKLYDKDETEFASNGIGGLPDAISCSVEEEINSIYELSMEYPDDGLHADGLVEGNIIMASHDSTGDLQPFRINRRTDNIDGILNINARHLSYDLSRIPSMPYHSRTPAEALERLKANAVVPCPFDFDADFTSTLGYWLPQPQSIRSVLHGGDNPMTHQWYYVLGGHDCEVKFDRWQVTLMERRGIDKNISIRYGVNMTGLEVISEAREGFNAVVPFFKRKGLADPVICDPPIVMLPDVVDTLGGAMALDLSDEFEEEPTPEQLETAALNWLETNQPWVTEKSITISFVELGETEEYKDFLQVQSLALGDSVMVHPKRVGESLGYGAKFRLVRAVYDVLRERYTETTLGRQQETASAIVTDINRRLKNVTSTVKWQG